MVTRGLCNLHIDGTWYRWFYPPRGQSSSPDAQSTLKTINQILSRSDKFNWDAVPFPTPLHFQLDYIYAIDEDAGHFTLTQWKNEDEALYPRGRRATLACIRETSLSTVDTLLEDVLELSKHNEPSMGLYPRTAQRATISALYGLCFTWRFYFDDICTWECSFPVFSSLAIELLRIAAWDFEVRDTDTQELPITFSSLPQWKAPTDEIFWFPKYLIVCCNTDQIGNFMATKARDFLSRNKNYASTVHGIAISIRHIALFEIRNGGISHSPPIPLVTNTSALHCSPGLRILAYIFAANRGKGFPAKSGEYWGVALPTELFDIILNTSASRYLVSVVQASFLVEKWYYSSIPQIHGIKLHNVAFPIPCCGKRNTSSATGVYCLICYTWLHMECTDLPSHVASDTDKYVCSGCRENRPCAALETGGIYGFLSQPLVGQSYG